MGFTTHKRSGEVVHHIPYVLLGDPDKALDSPMEYNKTGPKARYLATIDEWNKITKAGRLADSRDGTKEIQSYKRLPKDLKIQREAIASLSR